MSKEIFIYIAAVLLLLPLLILLDQMSLTLQFLMSAPFILLLGIPHGAIDNLLYTKNAKMKNAHFITGYLAIIGVNVLIWSFLPKTAYLLFLVLSAFHFGQSQFSHYFKTRRLIHRALALSWGVLVLSALILFNVSELQQLTSQYKDFTAFGPIHHVGVISGLFVAAAFSTVVLMLMLVVRKKELKIENLLMECLILLIILTTFYLVPLIIGFTLYFVILHSYKVLGEEYRYLRFAKMVQSRLGFIKLLTPFSLLSFLGIGALFLLIHLKVLNISYGYCALIIVSSITLPHVFVMNQFYKKAE